LGGSRRKGEDSNFTKKRVGECVVHFKKNVVKQIAKKREKRPTGWTTLVHKEKGEGGGTSLGVFAANSPKGKSC